MKQSFLPYLVFISLIFLNLSPLFAQRLEVKEHTLGNGFKILMYQRHTVPTLSLQVRYKVGSRNELPGTTGLSHMLEHMLFMSTKHYAAHEMDEIIERIGGSNNGATAIDYTFYYETVASDRLEIVIALEAERIQNALIKEDEFLSEREVVMEERRMRVDNNPYGRLFEDFMSVAYISHPYRISTIGWMDDLKAMTREDAWNHYKTFYTPSNSFAVLVGDFEINEAIAFFEKYFGPIPPGPKVHDLEIIEPPQEGERRIEIQKQANLPGVIIGYHVPIIGDPDFYVMDVISQILSSGASSRLYQKLIYEDQIAVNAYGYAQDRKDPSIFQFVLIAAKGHTTSELETATYALIEEMKTTPVDDKELQKAKNNVKADFFFAQESNEGLASRLAGYESIGVGWDYINTYPEKINMVTKADIMRVVEKYFTKKNRTVAFLTIDEEAGK
ncbi:MAG: insulinase family protein [Spirochaetales bacterium]|nr:insulinase family protein [Spirochaetales bacterium]